MDRAAIKRALNERSLLMRDVERTGLKRLVIACSVFLGAHAPTTHCPLPLSAEP